MPVNLNEVLSSKNRFFIETWGCQMNELDSQRIAGKLMEVGFLPTSSPEDAKIIILNSCAVREKAESKAFSRLGEYKKLKKSKDVLIGFCGCVAQEVGKKAFREDIADFIVGPGRIEEIGDVVKKALKGERVVAVGFPDVRYYSFDTVVRDSSYKGIVTVIEGCNQKCTFCIVPFTRGKEVCRPIDSILAEVKYLVDRGFEEIELLGQTVNHWKDPSDEKKDFAYLLSKVASIEGVKRLRFITSYPRDFSDETIEVISKFGNICPYIHIPVQSGSNKILKRMGRLYTVEEYLSLIEKIKCAIPGVAISTDIIVGFPGEDEKDFEDTLSLVCEVGFSQLYAFIYSPRPYTAATKLKGRVDKAIAKERVNRLLEIQKRIQLSLNRRLIGEEKEVVITGWGKEVGQLSGRTRCHRVVNFPYPSRGGVKFGKSVKVVIEEAFPYSLKGKFVGYVS